MGYQLELNTKYNRSNNSHQQQQKQQQHRTSMKSQTYSALTENMSEPRTSTAYSLQHHNINGNKRLSQFSNGGYAEISYSNGQKHITPLSDNENKAFLPFSLPQRTASSISSISSQTLSHHKQP